MAYTTISKSSDHFSSNIYTGTGSSQTIVTGHQSDLIWIKQRTTVRPNVWFDSVNSSMFASSNSKYLKSDSDAALTSNDSTQLTANSSTGFTLGTDSSDQVNHSGSTAVAHSWKANGAGSSNSDGSITSTVSANTTAGFSIVTGTQNASGSWTVGHGLGVVPSFYIVKTTGATSDWYLWHHSLGGATDGGKFLRLNNVAVSPANDSTVWNNTAPTSSVFSMGSNIWNDSATFVAYCFAEKPGFSKFSKYNGNGQQSDNAFVYTGFKPAFVIIKRQDQSTNWVMFDTARDTYNVGSKVLLPDNSAAETSGSQKIDFLSNGFKIRSSGNNTGDSSPYIYMAFAEAPLVGSNNIPCTAR